MADINVKLVKSLIGSTKPQIATADLVALLSCFLAVRSVNHNFSLLNLNLLTALAGLAFLAADMLINILDALSLIHI